MNRAAGVILGLGMIVLGVAVAIDQRLVHRGRLLAPSVARAGGFGLVAAGLYVSVFWLRRKGSDHV